MIKDIEIGTTRISVAEISDYEGSNRREKEVRAVADIIARTMGHNATLTHSADGAPHISGCNISISHSRKLAVVAFDDERPIGIDAEEWRPTISRTCKRFLSETEQNMFLTDRQQLNAWTIKEAVYKIVGSEAVEFNTAISINADQTIANCYDRNFTITPTDIGDTHISLATEIV